VPTDAARFQFLHFFAKKVYPFGPISIIIKRYRSNLKQKEFLFHGTGKTGHGVRQREKADAAADDPCRGGAGGEPAVQHRRPHLHRAH
jgi:hypothetical protein